mmetsp:Transcript_5388/g.22256  ORF Transcript_5388/g.22256 Transcript_5388/m.22256 type:complete len:318 (-) Transcript_5388:54-1007(-)
MGGARRAQTRQVVHAPQRSRRAVPRVPHRRRAGRFGLSDRGGVSARLSGREAPHARRAVRPRPPRPRDDQSGRRAACTRREAARARHRPRHRRRRHPRRRRLLPARRPRQRPRPRGGRRGPLRRRRGRLRRGGQVLPDAHGPDDLHAHRGDVDLSAIAIHHGRLRHELRRHAGTSVPILILHFLDRGPHLRRARLVRHLPLAPHLGRRPPPTRIPRSSRVAPQRGSRHLRRRRRPRLFAAPPPPGSIVVPRPAGFGARARSWAGQAAAVAADLRALLVTPSERGRRRPTLVVIIIAQQRAPPSARRIDTPRERPCSI